MTFKFFPCHGMSVKMVHLLDVEGAGGIIVAGVAIAALETNLITFLSQMLSDTLVRVPVI